MHTRSAISFDGSIFTRICKIIILVFLYVSIIQKYRKIRKLSHEKTSSWGNIDFKYIVRCGFSSHICYLITCTVLYIKCITMKQIVIMERIIPVLKLKNCCGATCGLPLLDQWSVWGRVLLPMVNFSSF